MTVYEGRLELDGFGHVFLPDTETSGGDVPSIQAWVADAIYGVKRPVEPLDTPRVRITLEVIEQ